MAPIPSIPVVISENLTLLEGLKYPSKTMWLLCTMHPVMAAMATRPRIRSMARRRSKASGSDSSQPRGSKTWIWFGDSEAFELFDRVEAVEALPIWAGAKATVEPTAVARRESFMADLQSQLKGSNSRDGTSFAADDKDLFNLRMDRPLIINGRGLAFSRWSRSTAVARASRTTCPRILPSHQVAINVVPTIFHQPLVSTHFDEG